MEESTKILLELTEKITAVQGDTSHIKQRLDDLGAKSDRSDSELRALLEERTEYARNRQDRIKMELDARIDRVSADVTELKNKKRNALEYWFNKVRDVIIWALIAAAIGAAFTKLNMPPPKL